jgi:predicted nucleic acid-binding protein
VCYGQQLCAELLLNSPVCRQSEVLSSAGTERMISPAESTWDSFSRRIIVRDRRFHERSGVAAVVRAGKPLITKYLLGTNNLKEFKRVPELQVENWV